MEDELTPLFFRNFHRSSLEPLPTLNPLSFSDFLQISDTDQLGQISTPSSSSSDKLEAFPPADYGFEIQSRKNSVACPSRGTVERSMT